jgi:hypothetical protein
MKQTIFALACFVGLASVFAYAVNVSMSLPDVHFSYATNECVNVVNYMATDNYNCQNLPPRFYHAWVQ